VIQWGKADAGLKLHSKAHQAGRSEYPTLFGDDMHELTQMLACKRLLSAVVTLAIFDACQPPHRSKAKAGMKYSSSRLSLDAMRFLMGDGVKRYVEQLDMDGDRFKDQLIKQMWDDSERGYLTEKISGQQRRNFRFNLHSFQNIPKAGQPMSDEEIDKGEKTALTTTED
jgi:hypothetical protein